MAMAAGLIFLLFDVASVREVIFAMPLYIYNAFFMDLPLCPMIYLCSPLKGVDFVIEM